MPFAFEFKDGRKIKEAQAHIWIYLSGWPRERDPQVTAELMTHPTTWFTFGKLDRPGPAPLDGWRVDDDVEGRVKKTVDDENGTRACNSLRRDGERSLIFQIKIEIT